MLTVGKCEGVPGSMVLLCPEFGFGLGLVFSQDIDFAGDSEKRKKGGSGIVCLLHCCAWKCRAIQLYVTVIARRWGFSCGTLVDIAPTGHLHAS